MIFIAKYTKLRVDLMPTTKVLAHGGSGSQEVLTYEGIRVKFENAVFDTKNWLEYNRPNNPEFQNPVKSEDDLIRLMKANRFFGQYFFERVVQSKAQQIAKAKEELARLEAEAISEDPEGAPETPNIQESLDNTPETAPAPSASQQRRIAATKKGKATPAKSTKNSKSSKVEL